VYFSNEFDKVTRLYENYLFSFSLEHTSRTS